MFNKNKIKQQMKKEGLHTLDDTNRWMDTVTSRLSNENIKKAYISSCKKYNKKPNSSTKYMLDYFTKKCNERGIKIQ